MVPEALPGSARPEAALATPILGLGEKGPDRSVSQTEPPLGHHRDPVDGVVEILYQNNKI